MRKTLEAYVPRQRDLISLEEELGAALKAFLKFEKIGLYFPGKAADREMIFLPDEGLLLAPLKWRNKFLGMLRLEGVSQDNVLALAPYLEKLLELILQKLLLERLAEKDRDSGLASEASFFKFMREELEAVQTRTEGVTGQSGGNIPFYRLCLGMIVIRWQEEELVIRQHDHEFVDHIYYSLAKNLLASVPEKVVAAPLGKYEGRHDFGLMFNATGRDACFKLARRVIGDMERQIFKDPLSGRKYNPLLYAGFALYPQDMAGEDLTLPIFEQIVRFRNRALLAAKMAKEQQAAPLEERILSYANLARKAGRILDCSQRDKIRINLGRAADVREGTRFLVWGKNREDGSEFLKGQITVLKSENTESIAEVFYLNKAEYSPRRGDRLSLPMPGGETAEWDEGSGLDGTALEERGRLLSHADFLEQYPQKAAFSGSFLLAIIRFGSAQDAGSGQEGKILNNFLKLYKRSSTEKEPYLAGKYGEDRLIIFMPEKDIQFGHKLMEDLFNGSENMLACGLAAYPYLDFGKADMEGNALKALEYGELLREPHIGVFNSMAITIDADKKFSMGDDFSAIEQYKKALMADPANVLARNSLAVCMAALGKTEEAKKLWLECLDFPMEGELRAKVCYNLGTACQKSGQRDEAFQWYRACLKNFQRHVYAWLRIGQLNEIRGRRKSAKRYYLCAANLSDAESDVFAIARRYLARLDLGDNEAQQARNTLHQLLYKNPYDTASMNILAELYLQENGDPAISEMLARKSLQIRDNEQAWRILARSLARLGKSAEAEKALQRAERRSAS